MSSTEIALVVSGLRRSASPRGAALRFVILEGEALRIPRARRALSVVNGTAWVTQRGRDTVLAAGDAQGLEPRADAALVSPLGSEPLILELR
jgi:hypothetical protein